MYGYCFRTLEMHQGRVVVRPEHHNRQQSEKRIKGLKHAWLRMTEGFYRIVICLTNASSPLLADAASLDAELEPGFFSKSFQNLRLSSTATDRERQFIVFRRD